MIHVIIAEDQTMLRQAMVQLIEMHKHIHVIADVGDGKSALKAAQETEADVLILDVEMPELTVLEVLQQI